MTDKISFDNLPEAVQELHLKLDLLLKAQSQAVTPDDPNKLMTVEELQSFLPEHPARQTVYQWVNYRTIPFEKYGRRLYFRKSAISQWLSKGRQI